LGKKLSQTGLFEKDLFQNHCILATTLSGTAKENTSIAPGIGTPPKDIFMSGANPKTNEALMPRENRIILNKKTGSRQLAAVAAAIAGRNQDAA